MIRKWSGNERCVRASRLSPFLPRMRSRTRGALPIVRDNYRINKFTSWRNAYNISTSAKWYRDTVVYHRGSYSPRPVTHCRAYVVSRYPFGSYPPRCSMARIVRHVRSTPLKNHVYLGTSGGSRRKRKLDAAHSSEKSVTLEAKAEGSTAYFNYKDLDVAVIITCEKCVCLKLA